MDNNFNTNVWQICRTCLQEITDTSFSYLDCTPAANTQLTIRQKLYSSISELDLSIVTNPVICSKCVDNIVSIFEFKKSCLQSEIQINKYIQQIQHTGDLNPCLNLLDVLRFHQSGIKNIEVKMEDLEITEDFKNEDLICGTSEPKYLLELQKVDTQDVLFNTLDDFNINNNLSAAEENLDTPNSNFVQKCLPEVIEHQDDYSKNLNSTNVYYQCYKCGHKAENKLKLIFHLKRHTQKNLIRKKTISKRLSEYYKNLFGYYKCSFCNYLTKYKCLFDFHNRIHLTKKNCKHIFKHTDVHTKTFHTTIKVNKTNVKDNKRKCAKNCNNDNKYSFKNRNKFKKTKQHFNNRNSLKLNMKAHITEKPYKCSICKHQCNCKVNKQTSLNQHMRIHTGEKPFSCSVCEYQCSQKSHLKQHILIHTGEKPFSCSICKYQCNRKSGLKRHALIHTGYKQFSCSICKYQCNQKSHLKQHILIHTGEKPFSCSVCPYQCSQQSSLQKHMLIHTGEKPFSCSVCEYQCSRKSSLQNHKRIHTGEKPFSCSVCESSVARKVT